MQFAFLQAIENFHCAIGPVLSMARIFGVFPVAGIRSISPSKLRFKIFSFITFYSSFIAAMVFFITILSVCHMLKTLNANTFHTRGKQYSSIIFLSSISIGNNSIGIIGIIYIIIYIYYLSFILFIIIIYIIYILLFILYFFYFCNM